MSTNEIYLDKILPNPEQPRMIFDEGALEELAASIREHGVILPISVEQSEDGESYILEDGERRWRAARLAGLVTIPATVHPPRNGRGSTTGTGGRARLERALVANIQRVQMNPIEEARAFRRLQEEFGLSQVRIGQRIGKDDQNGQTYVNNRLLLLRLDEEIQALIAERNFSSNVYLARALLQIPDAGARVKLVRRLVSQKASHKASLYAAKRLAAALNGKTLGEKDVPALDIGKRRAGVDPDEPENRARYDALVHTGDVPMWPGLKTAVQKACRSCVWHDAANEAICGECPVVDVVENLLGKCHE